MLKIATTDEGRWITYAPGVEIKVRPLTSSRIRGLRKAATTSRMAIDPDTRKMGAIDDFDQEKFEASMADYLIEDFKGIGDAAGNPLPVDLANKRLILDQVQVRDFVWAAAQSLDVTQDETKN